MIGVTLNAVWAVDLKRKLDYDMCTFRILDKEHKHAWPYPKYLGIHIYENWGMS